jgi:glycerol-3-phosphate dehydrogenase subunit B
LFVDEKVLWIYSTQVMIQSLKGIRKSKERDIDLVVIGVGLAGLASACFAQRRGLRVAVVGATPGEMLFASGAMDLLGIHPVEKQKRWQDPWAAMAALCEGQPDHPYARAGLKKIHKAVEAYFSFLSKAGLSYTGRDTNVNLVTPAGTLKKTYRVPASMWAGVEGLEKKCPALLVDFHGMKDYSAKQVAEVLRRQWPGLEAKRLDFPGPGMGKDRVNTLMAEELENPKTRSALAEAIRPFLRKAQLVGFPAILGIRKHEEVWEQLEKELGVPVFEIPTLPPSVPGLRLKETLEEALRDGGVELLLGSRVMGPEQGDKRCISVRIRHGVGSETVHAKGFILAAGRFIGGGLVASQKRIVEPTFGLDVHQPPKRESWHQESFFDPRGHAVNQAGLEIDPLFRPCGPDGSAVLENLFAAGSILAHHDWVRAKCGAGLAVATAYSAVEAFSRCCV